MEQIVDAYKAEVSATYHLNERGYFDDTTVSADAVILISSSIKFNYGILSSFHMFLFTVYVEV